MNKDLLAGLMMFGGFKNPIRFPISEKSERSEWLSEELKKSAREKRERKAKKRGEG
jgi:hypothetical protein